MYDNDEIMKYLLQAISGCDEGMYACRQSNQPDLARAFEKALDILENAEIQY